MKQNTDSLSAAELETDRLTAEDRLVEFTRALYRSSDVAGYSAGAPGAEVLVFVDGEHDTPPTGAIDAARDNHYALLGEPEYDAWENQTMFRYTAAAERGFTDGGLDISVGDTVRVHIESPANPFSDTQMGTFVVDEVTGGVVFGTDPNWGDECEILFGDGVPHYADFGKSGDVVSVHVMETTDEGVPIHGSGRVIYPAADDDTDTDADAGDVVDRGDAVMTDGGANIDDYDLDFDKLDIDESAHSRTNDSTNNISHHLARLEDSDLWVAWTAYATPLDGAAVNVTGLGHLSLSPADLDPDVIVATIREEFDGAAEVADMDAVAEDLITEWGGGILTVVDDHIYDGIAGVDKRYAWVSHVEEAVAFEAREVVHMMDLDLSECAVADFRNACARGLYAAVAEHRRSWLNSDADYIAEFELTAEPWELRALELQQHSVFRSMEKTAAVYALLEAGYAKSEAADVLDVNPSTVTRHADRIDEWVERANWSAENLTTTDGLRP